MSRPEPLPEDDIPPEVVEKMQAWARDILGLDNRTDKE